VGVVTTELVATADIVVISPDSVGAGALEAQRTSFKPAAIRSISRLKLRGIKLRLDRTEIVGLENGSNPERSMKVKF
jgi:hypothetical protein